MASKGSSTGSSKGSSTGSSPGKGRTGNGRTGNGRTGNGRPATTNGRADRTGAAAELHQLAQDGRPQLTTQQGVPVSDDQNTLRVGERGPAALEDFHFREKLFHFDHERIPERVVHARGF